MLFGYDQGVVSGILTMESFAAAFPRIYMDNFFKGWFTSTLLLAAWLGSLVNGPIADRIGRKGSILLAVVIFVVGSALQAGAQSIPMLFIGMYSAHSVLGIILVEQRLLTMDCLVRSCYCWRASRYAHHDCASIHV